MPKSNNPFDLINALEDRYNELTMNACSDINAAEIVDDEITEAPVNAEVANLWNQIVAYNIATDDELQLVTSIFGYTIDNLNKVIYTRTGYDDIETYLGEVYPE